MSKSLETQREALTKKVDELQVRAAEETFAITLDDRKQVKLVMDHLNKGYTWKTANAAVLVSLYDQLKKQNKELKKALLSSLDARIYSLLNLCGFNNSNQDEEEFGEG